MIEFLKKYKAFIFGLLIQRIIVSILLYFEFIHIDNSAVLANTLSFIFSWLLISLPIHYFSFLKQHKVISLKLVTLIFIFIVRVHGGFRAARFIANQVNANPDKTIFIK